jgi:hypothetical protein
LISRNVVAPDAVYDWRPFFLEIPEIGLRHRPLNERQVIDKDCAGPVDGFEQTHEVFGVFGIIPRRANIDGIEAIPVHVFGAPGHDLYRPAQ